MRNREVAHEWVYYGPDGHTGKSSNGNLWYDGNRIYSYRTLMGIINDDGSVFLNCNNYSGTTSKHQSYIRQAVSHMPVVYMRAESLKPIDEIPLLMDELSETIKNPIKSKDKLYKAKMLEDNISVLKQFDYLSLSEEEEEDYSKLLDRIVEGTEYLQEKAERAKQPNENKIKKLNRAVKKLGDVSSKTLSDIQAEVTDVPKKDRDVVAYMAMGLPVEGAKGDQLYLLSNQSLWTSKGVRLSPKDVVVCVGFAKRYLADDTEGLEGKHIGPYTILEVTPEYVQVGCHTIMRDTLKVLLRDYNLITKGE